MAILYTKVSVNNCPHNIDLLCIDVSVSNYSHNIKLSFLDFSVSICLNIIKLLDIDEVELMSWSERHWTERLRWTLTDEAAHQEANLVTLTNHGEVNIFSVPNLRRQVKYDVINKESVK